MTGSWREHFCVSHSGRVRKTASSARSGPSQKRGLQWADPSRAQPARHRSQTKRNGSENGPKRCVSYTNRIISHRSFVSSRYKELIEKNERTKALIKKRDEDRKVKAEKQLLNSSIQADIYMEQKRRALDYCTAKGNFGDKSRPIRKVNNFKRQSKSSANASRSPKRVI